MHTLYTDGSYAQELEIAAIGGYLLNPSGQMMWSYSQRIYEDMAYHELKSIEYALQKCLDSGIKNIQCYTDSATCVRNLNGIANLHRNKNYETLLNKVLALLVHFEDIKFTHIPRKKNKKADLYAGKTLSKATKTKSRALLYQSINPSHNYVKHKNLICSEQFSNKDHFNTIRYSNANYFVFDLYREQQYHSLDVYFVEQRVEGVQHIKYQKIHSYTLTDIWSQYLKAIAQTLCQYQDKSINLMLCPANNEIDLILRGMKAYDSLYNEQLKELLDEISNFEKVVIHNDELIYQTLFNHHKLN